MALDYVRKYKSGSDSVTEGTPESWECSPVPAVGEPILVERFGGNDLSKHDEVACITLEWGSTTAGWELLRSISTGSHEYILNRDLVGDGDKRIKVTRTVVTTGVTATLDYWLEYGPRT